MVQHVNPYEKKSSEEKDRYSIIIHNRREYFKKPMMSSPDLIESCKEYNQKIKRENKLISRSPKIGSSKLSQQHNAIDETIKFRMNSIANYENEPKSEFIHVKTPFTESALHPNPSLKKDCDNFSINSKNVRPRFKSDFNFALYKSGFTKSSNQSPRKLRNQLPIVSHLSFSDFTGLVRALFLCRCKRGLAVQPAYC